MNDHTDMSQHDGEPLIVLNEDTVICGDCYELNAPSETTPEVDPGQVPFGRTSVGQCSSCGLYVSGAKRLITEAR